MEKKIDKGLFIALAFFFGYLGVDRFLRGQVGLGILKLLLSFTLIWNFIDLIIILTKWGNYEDEFVFINGKWAK